MTRSYRQFCPVAKAAEILAERWTPLVIRELLCGSRHFNDLRRGVPLMSPSLLSQRLKYLEDQGLVESRGDLNLLDGDRSRQGGHLPEGPWLRDRSLYCRGSAVPDRRLAGRYPPRARRATSAAPPVSGLAAAEYVRPGGAQDSEHHLSSPIPGLSFTN